MVLQSIFVCVLSFVPFPPLYEYWTLLMHFTVIQLGRYFLNTMKTRNYDYYYTTIYLETMQIRTQKFTQIQIGIENRVKIDWVEFLNGRRIWEVGLSLFDNN